MIFSFVKQELAFSAEKQSASREEQKCHGARFLFPSPLWRRNIAGEQIEG